jgi:hypothetical protein
MISRSIRTFGLPLDPSTQNAGTLVATGVCRQGLGPFSGLFRITHTLAGDHPTYGLLPEHIPIRLIAQIVQAIPEYLSILHLRQVPAMPQFPRDVPHANKRYPVELHARA